MKKLLALSITYFSFLGVYAQNLDLSKFALPEYKRNELQFSLAGNNSSGNTNNFDKDGNDQGNSYNYNTNNNFNGNLYSFHNSERFQGVFRTGYAVQSPQVNNNKMENLNLTQSNKSRSNYYNYYVSSTNRFYFPSKWFIEADPQMSINYYNYNYRTVYSFNDPNLNSISESSSKNNSIKINTELRFGKGRVEPVEDMRQAVYILQDLEKAGRLKRDINQQDAGMLAVKLSALKNKRYLNSRNRLIKELTGIEQIMTDMDLITDNDALFTAIVNDYWSMAANPSRSSGRRFSLGVNPGYSYNKYNDKITTQTYNPDTINTYENFNKINGYSVYTSLLYENYKPISLQWQQDCSAEISMNLINSEHESGLSQKNEYNMAIGGLKGNYSLTYYKNSRTSFSWHAGILYQKGKGKEKNSTEKDVQYKLFVLET